MNLNEKRMLEIIDEEIKNSKSVLNEAANLSDKGSIMSAAGSLHTAVEKFESLILNDVSMQNSFSQLLDPLKEILKNLNDNPADFFDKEGKLKRSVVLNKKTETDNVVSENNKPKFFDTLEDAFLVQKKTQNK